MNFLLNVNKISWENVLGPLSRKFEATAHEQIVVSQYRLWFTDQVFHRKKMGISIFSTSWYDLKFKLALEKPLDVINLITWFCLNMIKAVTASMIFFLLTAITGPSFKFIPYMEVEISGEWGCIGFKGKGAKGISHYAKLSQ